MPDTYKYLGKWYISSNHCRQRGVNAVIIRVTKMYENSKGEKVYVPAIEVDKDPERSFWVTKPEYRNYSYKKEFELVDHCDEYRCHDSELVEQIGLVMGTRWLHTLRQVCDSPYVYGADIETEAIVKQRYLKYAPPNQQPPYTKGGLDIETEMIGEKRINLITYIHQHEIYSCGLADFCKVYPNGDTSTPHKATLKEIETEVRHWVGDLITEYGFNLHLKICNTEVEMIKWIFDCIHECKTDFIGVWNIDFDIPKILERLKAKHVDPAVIMCHKDVPAQYRFVKYIEDNSNPDNFTDKWYWMQITGYSQFIDAMCLYAQLRKVYGREPSYALDKIADKELGLRKLHFDNSELVNHRYEQEYHFLRYWAYNINDVLIMQLMEFQNDDYGTLASLSDVSLLSEFHHMTSGLKCDAYVEGLAHGLVPASVGQNSFTKYDEALFRVGGTVLPPNKAENVSVPVIKEIPQGKTLVSVLTNDLDVSSFYPSSTEEFNISRESTLATIHQINGFPVTQTEHFTSCIVQPEASAMDACTTYFGLPGYSELKDLFAEHLKKSQS